MMHRTKALAALASAACLGLLAPISSAVPAAPTPPKASAAIAPTSLEDAMFRVGPAEIVYGPNQYIDSFLVGVKVDTNGDGVGDTVRAYIAQNKTKLLEGTTVANLVATGDTVIDKGSQATDDFDECGAWLQAVYVDPDDATGQTLRAWYHAEKNCDYPNGQARASIAYARSTNGGLTFTKVNHPNNQVVRADPTLFPEPVCDPENPTPETCKHTGRGANTVLIRNGEYWMYYKDTDSGRALVAKASIASDGTPGSWNNYTTTSPWTQPAIEGAASGLTYANGSALQGGAASRYTPDNSVVIVKHFDGVGEGIQLSNSTDGLTAWVKYAEVLVPVVEQRPWGSSLPTDEQRFGYPSIVNTSGARAWGGSFYLFYLYIQPGNPMDQRLLVRRRVTVTTDDGSRPSSIVALSSWDTSTRDRWDSASVVSAVYPQNPESTQGYIATVDHGAASAPLYDCEAPDGDNYPAQTCLAGDKQKRTTGYIWTSATAQAGTVTLYRCRDNSDGDDFVSVDVDCDDEGQNKWIAGWILPNGTV